MLAAVLALLPARAHAQDARVAADRVEPSERGSEWLVNESLDLVGALRPSAGAVLSRATRPVVLPGNAPVEDLVVVHVGSSVTLVDRVRLAFNLPLQLYGGGKRATLDGADVLPPTKEQGAGDLRFGVDVRLFGEHRSIFTSAVGLQVWLPTGQQSQWMGDGGARARPRVMAAGEYAKHFVWAAQLGYGYRERAQAFGEAGLVGSDLQFSAAAGARLKEDIVIGPEIVGATAWSDAFSKRATPIEALISARWHIVSGLRIGLAAGVGVTSAVLAAERRLAFSIEWTQPTVADSDGDGVRDDADRCPHEPGIATGNPRTNGCPKVMGTSDRDGDGILDRDDACPYAPGPRTDDPDTNGCPPDRDRDGVADAVDACPDAPGVPTRDPKTNGCPPDTDDDGIDDLADACPKEPGIRTSDPMTNGCPDRDRDKDNIPNDLDACPDDAGPPDIDPKRNGCPKAWLHDGRIDLADQPKFIPGTAELAPEGNEILELVVKVLEAHPEVRRVRVEGHTDNRGSYDAQKKLSAARAQTIVKWLVEHGIDEGRLTSQGYGPDRPVDTNETEAGRANNTRIELNVVTK